MKKASLSLITFCQVHVPFTYPFQSPVSLDTDYVFGIQRRALMKNPACVFWGICERVSKGFQM